MRNANFFKPEGENPVIEIRGSQYVDFESIDTRIKHNGRWIDTYPCIAKITVPRDFAAEIIIKLKSHCYVTSVNGEMTEHGIAVQAAQAEHARQFRSMRQDT